MFVPYWEPLWTYHFSFWRACVYFQSLSSVTRRREMCSYAVFRPIRNILKFSEFIHEVWEEVHSHVFPHWALPFEKKYRHDGEWRKCLVKSNPSEKNLRWPTDCLAHIRKIITSRSSRRHEKTKPVGDKLHSFSNFSLWWVSADCSLRRFFDRRILDKVLFYMRTRSCVTASKRFLRRNACPPILFMLWHRGHWAH